MVPAALLGALALLWRAAALVPSAPLNLSIKKITSTEIHLTWLKPLNSTPNQFVSPEKHAEVSFSHLPLSPLSLVPLDDHENTNFALSFADKYVGGNTFHESELDNQDFRRDDEDDGESRRTGRGRFFHRKKRRRDAVSDNPDMSKILADPSSERPTSKKNENAFVETTVVTTTESPEMVLIYMLFHEEGASGESINHWKGEMIHKRPENKSLVHKVELKHHEGKDGIKGVKYTLKELKPYTYYRIWVRAFYASVHDIEPPRPSNLGPPSFRIVGLTDVMPPSQPIMKNVTCNQPPGALYIQWGRPEMFTKGLDLYTITLRLLNSKSKEDYSVNTTSEELELATNSLVTIFDNMSIYEVTIHASTLSIATKGLYINGTPTDAYQVVMTPDCVAAPPFGINIGQGAELGSDDEIIQSGNPILGYVTIFLILIIIVLCAILGLYYWGCSSVFKKCFPMSYLFLDEGGTVGGSDGCGEAGLTGKAEGQLNCIKKNITSPTHAVIFWDPIESNGANLVNSREHLCDPLHPPVPADKFLPHTAALHADGDIGFGKEYELIQSKSAMLAHTSHHSQHPDNKHKNRYLNITAYDHSRVCLLPSSSCSCDPGREHRKSCTSKLSGSQNDDSPPHCDYVNANFIDGMVAELDPELSKFIIEENNKRKVAQKKKLEAADAPAPVHPPSDLWITVDESQRAHNFVCPKPTINEVESNSDTKNLLSNFNGQDDARCTMKGKLSLDLEKKDERRILSPNSEILASTCRLSINLDRKEDKQDDVKSEKSIKELKNKKRSTSADTKDIVIDKKGNSRGHSKNSSVVVATIDNSPLNNAPKIEGAFLNIEFSGIVDDKEVKKVNNMEKLNEINGNTKEPVEETLDDLDNLFVKIDGEEYRVNSSWLLDRRRYIGTQGPTPGTLPAFWRMVWDHKVVVIVMITNLVERGRRKCDMYWPKDGTETYGAFQVSTLQEDVMATYTVRTFQIKNTKLNTSRPVLQYHYTVWPDHGTPEHPIAVLRFREAARKAAPPQAGAVLVHCSAGVGRTGTYIVLDAMLNHLKLTGSLNVFGFLCHVRTQRNFLVQTEEQYVFIHDALLEAIQSGNTEVSTENAKEYLKKLLTPYPEGYIHDSMLNIKCGLYGAPLKEKPPTILAVPRPCNDKININNSEECDFAMWSNVDDVRYSNDKSLEECRNDIVSISLQKAKLKQSDNESKSDKNHLLNGEKDTDNSSNSNCEPDDNNKVELEDISPELILDDVKDDQKIIDFEEDNVYKKKNGETVSTGSNNAPKSENQSNSFEKVNGNCNNESKASSISNEDIELSLNENNSNGLNGNGNKSAEKVAAISTTGENSNTITSSISSDTNNLNMANFRDKDSNSPGLSNQDPEYNKKKNYRIKYDDNYELLSNSIQRPDTLSGLPMDCFAGSHQFACQKKDFGNVKPKNLLEQQFKMITSFEPSKFHTMSACKQVNITKNRQRAVLPIESGRVHLIPKPGIEGTDYINATWLQGHRSLREYVVTQHPLTHTVTDLYRLLWDHTCQIVVVLTDHTEDSECKLFWPTEKNPEITTYNYNIRYISEVKHVAKRIALCDIGNKKNLHKLMDDDSSLDTPLNSPSSTSSNKTFNLTVCKDSQRASPVSQVENQDDHCMNEEKLDNSFYRRQFSNDKQDEEKLIPKSDESNFESEESEELKKLNSESKPEGYMFDKSELQIDTTMCNNISETSKLSPKCSANGDPFNSSDDSKKSQKSPSKLSLRSFKLSSPILKSPIKFDFGARNSVKIDDNHDFRSHQKEEQTNFESKFVMIPLIHMCQLREGTEDIGLDCVITTTHITMCSLQDDYELKIKLIECPKWLADLDYDENSDTDDESQEDEYEMEAKDLDYVIDQRLKAYKGVFSLPEYMAKCQDEAKNSPVVVVDKLGGARATALCTLGGVLRQKSRDVYSLAKLHHGRRAGAWRRPADLRALYEALAAYEHPPLSSSNPT